MNDVMIRGESGREPVLTIDKGPHEKKGNVRQCKEDVNHLELVRAKLKRPAEGDDTENIDRREGEAGERPSRGG